METDFGAFLAKTGEIGFVQRTASSLAYIEGLPGAKPQEMVVFESGDVGQIMTLTTDAVEAMHFSRVPMRTGSRVARTDRLLEIPVGPELLGMIIDPLGHSLDLVHPLPALHEHRPIEVAPPGIQARLRITRPCDTGVSLVDLLIPLGKGQRELIIGDQKTGKSRFVLRALLTQVMQGSIGIYAVIGKSQTIIKQIEESLVQLGIREKTIVIAASADAPIGLTYLTPYAAMTIAEYFRDQGRDVFMVLDDLTTHAKVYREISLLGRRFPGRNSYPGDIFYAHSRLLERAGNFKTAQGEAAITCLPVAEAVHGDLTGYIQTNLMSMTDGHLLFDHALFTQGRRPAIDLFLSITRVGRQTQSALRQEITQELMAFFINSRRIHAFESFGAELGESVKEVLQKEKRIMEFLDQTAYDMIGLPLQIMLFGMVWGGQWREKSIQEIRLETQKIVYLYDTREDIRAKVGRIISELSSLGSLASRLKELSSLVS